MAKESRIDVEHAIKKGREHCWILIGGAQAVEECAGRFQFLTFEIFGDVGGQRAIGAVEQNARLALDQQAQFGQFVFQDRGARHQSVHNSFPQRVRKNWSANTTSTGPWGSASCRGRSSSVA